MGTTSITVPDAEARAGVPRSAEPAMLKSSALWTSEEWW
ncbi:hypothetical protein RKD24_000385 [Streptomyces calvus]